jgi:trimethylamine--corrinoid protein Co-methyltransferase
MWVDDAFTKRRYAKLDDIPLAARLADGLPMINIVGAMSDPSELPVEYRCVEVACALLKHTVKPIHMWFYNRSTAQYLLELLIAITGSEENVAQYPITFPFLEPISPLRFPYDGIDILFETSTLSLPTPVGPMAQMGASAPATLAGTLAQENAEILAGICVTQLIKPGLAIFYGGLPHAFDMRTTQTIFAGPEQALMAIAMVQMGKYYGLPVGVNVGLTDSKTLDAQAGLEVGTSLICGAMAGADIFGAFGISGVDQGASLVMLVMQHEIIQYVERILSGISLEVNKFGLDVVHSVGPGGTFFAEKHTVENFREELWFPELLDRQYWENWAKEGGYTMQQRCSEMKDKILRDHVPIPLDETVAKELDKIVDAAKRHLSSEVV